MKKVFYLLFLLCAIPSYMFAQRITITGRVTDSASGGPIVHASVELLIAKERVTGTLTNSNGEYKLTTDSAAATIVFSYVGMTTVTEEINNRSEINGIMAANNSTLNDVVVVGFGTQTKATLTGAVSEISGKELVTTQNENVVNMLSGKIPGVRITQTSSRPGAFESNIDIRGMGSPLVVVDGIPRDVGYFSRMNAADIASVSVLKDASAAVYGLHSANGVILVTTKRGTNSGKYDIQYSVNRAWQQFLHVPHNVDALQYMTLANEKNRHNFATDYMNYGDPSHLLFTDQDFAPFLNGSRQTTDWYDAVFVNTAPEVQHNITVNGGTDKLRFYFNLGYMNQESSLRSEDMNYHKWNFRSNIDANITKRLHATVSIDGYMDQQYQPNTDIWAIYKDVWVERPDVPIYANNDPTKLNYYQVKSDNPLAQTNADMTGFSKYLSREFNGRVSLSYDIPKVDGLTAKAMYNYHYHEGDNTDYHKAFNLYNYDSTTDTYATSVRHAVNGISSIQRAFYPSYSDLMQLSLNYKHTFGGAHNVEALALFEDAYGYNDNFYAYREMSLNSSDLFAGNADNQIAGMDKNGYNDNTSQAVVGKVDYNYKGKYLIDFGFRYDGSSKFPEGSRWGFFPSVSAGWRISEEPFFKRTLPQLTNLKFRGSYGKTGDDATAFNYPSTIVGYELVPNDIGYVFDGSVISGVTPTAIPNPDLTYGQDAERRT